MDDRTNTIAGWSLFAAIVALGSWLLVQESFHTGRPEKMGYPIEGVEEEQTAGAPVAEQPIAVYLASADPALGEAVFKKCVACHDATKGGPNKVGPNLWGIVGAARAHHAAFAYSDALKSKTGNWDWESMSAWLKSPKAFAPGTKMTFLLPKPEDRANLLAWLNKQSDSPLALPAAPAGASPAQQAAEAADAPAAAGKAENEPVLTEGQAARQPSGRVGGPGAPAVAGSASQTKL